MPGKGISDIQSHLNTTQERYKRVYVGPGSNDCASDKSTREILEDYTKLISEAKLNAENVVVTSILPRGDTETVDTKIREVNSGLKKVTTETGVTFVDNDANFRYSNGTYDEELLLPDKIHLSLKGVRRLISNLDISTKVRPRGDKSSSVTCEGQSPPKLNPPRKSVLFKQENDELSNFFRCELQVFDKKYDSAEAAYQHFKALDHGCHNIAQDILDAENANDVKTLSHRITTNREWPKKKIEVMMQVLTAKLEQCEPFRNRLAKTGTMGLIEDTPHEFWGRGSLGKGDNMMGVLLMKLREKIIARRQKDRPSHTRSYSAVAAQSQTA